MDNHFIQQKQHGGQEQQHHSHAQQRTAGNQAAHGGDDVHIGIQAYAIGGGEESEPADQDALSGGSHGLFHRILLVHASQAVLLVPGGHQDGVVHGSAQLNGGYQDGPHEGQLRARVIGDTQVGGNGQLDDRYQQHRQ